MNTLWFNWFMAEYRSVAALPWPEDPYPEYPTEMKGLIAALIAGVVSRELDNPETERIVRDLLIEPKRTEGVSVWERLAWEADWGGTGHDTWIGSQLLQCWAYLHSPIWENEALHQYKVSIPLSKLYENVTVLSSAGRLHVLYPLLFELFSDDGFGGTTRCFLLPHESMMQQEHFYKEVILTRLSIQWFPEELPLQWDSLNDQRREVIGDWAMMFDLPDFRMRASKRLQSSPLPYGFWEPALPYLPLQPEEDINVLKNKVRDLLRLCNEKNTPEEINRRLRQNR